MADLFTDADHSSQWGNLEPEWQNILHSLQLGQYAQVESALTRLLQAAHTATHPDLTVLLNAALLLCLSCASLKSQAEGYRLSYQDVLQREAALRQELCELLEQSLAWSCFQTSENTIETPGRRRGAPASPPARRFIPALVQAIRDLFAPETTRLPTQAEDLLTNQAPAQGAPPAGQPDQVAAASEVPIPASVVVFCLGKFQVYLEGQLVTNWPASKGKSIFKYLLAHREKPIAREILMDLFWPDTSPESARRNLNWAIHNLRQVLHKYQPDLLHIIFQNECYYLNPELKIWLDMDEFEAHINKAKALKDEPDVTQAALEYQAADLLYHGEFLEEDRYEDWVQARRQALQEDYLHALDTLSRYYYDRQNFDEAIRLCARMLAADPCREEAHVCLMRCYARRGQPYLAIRQYQACVESLKTELDVQPSPLTTALYEAIRLGKSEAPAIGSQLA